LNGSLFARTFSAYRARLLVGAVGLFAWGFVLPVIYATFGQELRELVADIPLLSQFSQFGGGDVFSLHGSIALGFIHPFTLVLTGIFAIGFATTAVAGERQAGTLEVILARPISRRTYLLTLFVTGALFLAILLVAHLAGSVAGASFMGVIDELSVANLPVLFLLGWMMFMAFMTIGLAASVSFDRLGPALSITLAIVLISYLLEVIGSLWPDAEFLRDYSLFHHLAAKEVLDGNVDGGDIALFGAVILASLAYAWLVFPRRDLAAPD
jgi:ABC-2 type transport system permease protein